LVKNFWRGRKGKTHMKQRTRTISLAVLFLIFGISITAAEKVDLSGTWGLDKSRSEGVPPGMDQTMTVKQTGDLVEVKSKINSAQGAREIEDQFTLDGKEKEFSPGGPQSKGRRTSKWDADGKGFYVTEEATIERGNGPEAFKVTRHWQLSGDGKILTIEMTFDEPGGPGKSKRVFVRK